jgi:hypothetical protein
MQALDQLLRSVPMSEAPAGLRAQVMARINRREQARRAILGGLALVLGTVTLTLLLLAPFTLDLLSALGDIAPALLVGGLETIDQLLVLVDALGRTAFILLDQLALPLAVVSLSSLLVAVALNGLWIRTLRRLSIAR